MAVVYVVESGEYDNRGIDLIASSVEAAVVAIKDIYKEPYIVDWGDLEQENGWHSLRGRFAAVIGYSIAHTCTFDITEWELK